MQSNRPIKGVNTPIVAKIEDTISFPFCIDSVNGINPMRPIPISCSLIPKFLFKVIPPLLICCSCDFNYIICNAF